MRNCELGKLKVEEMELVGEGRRKFVRYNSLILG